MSAVATPLAIIESVEVRLKGGYLQLPPHLFLLDLEFPPEISKRFEIHVGAVHIGTSNDGLLSFTLDSPHLTAAGRDIVLTSHKHCPALFSSSQEVGWYLGNSAPLEIIFSDNRGRDSNELRHSLLCRFLKLWVVNGKKGLFADET